MKTKVLVVALSCLKESSVAEMRVELRKKTDVKGACKILSRGRLIANLSFSCFPVSSSSVLLQATSPLRVLLMTVYVRWRGE